MKQTMPCQGKFELISLPFGLNDLKPVISAETIGFHHGKHLQTYVNNLNTLLNGSEHEGKSLEEIVRNSSGPIFNNAGQILNHNMYFSQLTKPDSNTCPSKPLADALIQQFGSLETFKEEFEKKAISLFGSGWTWLSITPDGLLEISQESNACNPLQRGNIPLLTIDVWEHAYHLDYQNKRPAYVNAFWQIIDWDVISSRYNDR